jgi:hypothetical protein
MDEPPSAEWLRIEEKRLEEEQSWLRGVEETLMPRVNTPIELRFDESATMQQDYDATMQRYAPILTCGGVLVPVEKTNVLEPELNAGQKRNADQMSPASPDDPNAASQENTQLHCPWHALAKLMDIALHIVPAARQMY